MPLKDRTIRLIGSETTPEALVSPPLVVGEREFASAAKAFDDTAFSPEPLDSKQWPIIGRPLYLTMLQRFRDVVPTIGLVQAEEFHALLWLMMRLGGEQNFVARDQHVSKAVVSRWVLAEQTPRPERRRGILLSALKSLELAVRSPTPPVPLLRLEGRRAELDSSEPWEAPKINTSGV